MMNEIQKQEMREIQARANAPMGAQGTDVADLLTYNMESILGMGVQLPAWINIQHRRVDADLIYCGGFLC